MNSSQYVEQLEAHMDEGGTVTNANVRDLIQMTMNKDQFNSVRSICPTCNGNGYVLRDGDIEQCSTCDSEGETYVQENSAHCGGNGEPAKIS